MADFLSYAEQAGHYFDRPHDTLPTAPVGGNAAWRGADLADSAAWRVRLDRAGIEELDAALAVASRTGRPTGSLRASDFPLPTLAGEIGRWRDEIEKGRGFLVVAGLPVERWSREESERAFWCIGLHLGRPGAQNPQGDLLGHVTDTGADAKDPFVRLYATRSRIAWHCDAADVVGLLCLRTAKRGGASRIASSVTVHDELLRRRPDLVPRLYEPFRLDIRNEDSSGGLRWVPVAPGRHANGRLRTFYHSDYFRSVVRHEDVPPFTPGERELLDLYEEIASTPGVHLDMSFEPGDVQWLSNHTVIHARTAYEDDPDPARRRHLLRLWLSIGRSPAA